MTPDLIDISHHQGSFIDFAAVKAAGVQGVWMKASQGSTMVDSKFTHNAKKARDVGLHVGGYHYAVPRRSSGKVQATHFLTMIGEPNAKVDLRAAALDLESDTQGMSKAEVVDWIDEFLETVQGVGWKTITYSRESFARPYGFVQHPSFQWVARYRAAPPDIAYKVWQYTDRARVPGITGRVDGDRLAPGLTIDKILT